MHRGSRDVGLLKLQGEIRGPDQGGARAWLASWHWMVLAPESLRRGR